MKCLTLFTVGAVVGLLCSTLHAQTVPQMINYQGRMVVGTTNFNGTGQFKFALVNAAGSATYWSNDGTSVAGSQPTNPVSLSVANGLYSVLLGDASLTNMTTLPIIDNLSKGVQDVRLRVWFNDGTRGFQMLLPDQQIGAVGYAFGAADSARIGGQTVVRGKVDNATTSGTGFSVTYLPAGSNGVTLPSQLQVTQNSSTVIGFNSPLVQSQYIMLPDGFYRIASIQNNNQLTLTRVYNGPSGLVNVVKQMTLFPRYTIYFEFSLYLGQQRNCDSGHPW